MVARCRLGTSPILQMNRSKRQKKRDLNRLASVLTTLRLGRSVDENDPEWTEEIKRVWRSHNRPFMRLQDIEDDSKLDGMLFTMKNERQRLISKLAANPEDRDKLISSLAAK